MRVMKAAEKCGCILSVPGHEKHVDNNIYVCGVKNCHDYSGSEEKREWLFVDSRYVAVDGKIPDNILAPLRRGLRNRKDLMDGMNFEDQLFN